MNDVTQSIVGNVPPEYVYHNVVFTKDGNSVAFIAGSQGTRFLVQWPDGRQQTGLENAKGLVMNRLGHAACQVRKARAWHVAVNGTAGPGYRWVGDPRFSQDGAIVGYWAMNQGDDLADPQEYWFHVGETRYGPYGGYGGFVVWDNGEFAAGVGDRNGAFLIRNGIRGEYFRWRGRMTVSPIDRSLWTWGQRSDGWYLYRDSEVIDRSDEASFISGPVWDATGQYCAYWRVQNRKWHLVLNGAVLWEAESAVEHVGEPVIATNGVVAVPIVKEGREHMRAGGADGPAFEALGRPVLSSDGGIVAYKGRRGDREYLVVNDKLLCEHDATESVYETPTVLDDIPVLSADGKRVACVGKLRAKYFVCCNGVCLNEVNTISVGPGFEPSADKLIWGGGAALEKLYVGEDVFGPFDSLWCSEGPIGETTRWRVPSADLQGRLAFAVTIGNELHRLMVRPQP